MALSLQTIINFTETPFKLKLLAGRQGIKKNVSWVCYAEDKETIEFIRGNELAITLGVNYERSKDNLGIHSENDMFEYLKEFVDEFIKHGATGLVLNTGKYIKAVPQKLIDYCDEKDFPLFSMPWEIHTIDLMQEIGNMIANDNLNTQSVEKYFYKAIFEKNDFDPLQVKNTVFRDTKEFMIVLIELKEELFNDDMMKIKRYVEYNFCSHLNIKQNEYACFIHNHRIIFIMKDAGFCEIHEIFNNAKSDKFFKDSKISISDVTNSVTGLSEIYIHAEAALEINASPEKINFYDDLGIYKILIDVRNKGILKNFYKEKLGKLETMEEAKHEDFLHTLDLYLKTGGNILQVAKLNNAHRNTIIYRINKMEELLFSDFSDGETRTELQVALYIKNLLEKNMSKEAFRE